MAQNKSFDPPITYPFDKPPRVVVQVDTQSETSEWSAIPRIVPKPEGGIPLQPAILGKSNNS